MDGEKPCRQGKISVDPIDKTNEIQDDDFSDNLNNLFDEPALDLLINLLSENYERIKSKLRTTLDYLDKTKLVNELHITESELVRFRNAKAFNPEIIMYRNNMSLDEFDL